MSGHSKWATIKHQKETTDQKRGQAFSKIIRAMTVAARDNPDPESNFKLRLLIDKAREVNMPKDNVERAIARGSGKGGEAAFEEITYEGYGPEGTAILVEVVTDNRNRATAEIKNMFDKYGGKIGSPGSVSFQFEKTGQIMIEKKGDAQEQLLALIDLGVDDVEDIGELMEAYVATEKLAETKQKIETAGFRITSAGMIMKPKVSVQLEDKQRADRVLKFIDAIEEHDDVQHVYANFDIPDEFLNA